MARNIYFSILPNLLPKSDMRYQRWIKSLKKRPPPWNKNKTKEIDPSVNKISKTFKQKGLDNFATWRQNMIERGIVRTSYPPLDRSGELAFLIGMTFGDGNIQRFPRTERLLISLNSKYPNLIDYVSYLISKVFSTQARVQRVKESNCVRVWIYQKKISKRLRIPTGNRRWTNDGIPKWVWSSKKYIIECLKGLFEAEGSLSIHLPTSTYNFQFSNKNRRLLDDVERALKLLGRIASRENHSQKGFVASIIFLLKHLALLQLFSKGGNLKQQLPRIELLVPFS